MAALATHYEVAPDHMQLRFYLRGHPHPKGTRLPDSASLPVEYSRGIHAPPDSAAARWSDGSTITAHDFVYAWRRAVDPRTAAPVGSYLSIIKNAGQILAGKIAAGELGVSAPDDFTLIVDLEEPAPYLLSLLSLSVFSAVPSLVVEKARRMGHEERWVKPEFIVTSGPFVLAEWRPYNSIRVRRSRTYYQADLVGLDEVVFLPVGADAAVANLYRAGGTHAMELATLPEALTPALISKKDFHADPMLGVTAYSMNVHRPPFNNVLLRYALNMSLDKEAIGRYLNSPPAKNITPPSDRYQPPQSLPVRISGRQYDVLEYNPAAARQLLALAGYPDGIAKDGRPLTFDIRTVDQSSAMNVAQILARQWFTNLHVEARVSPAEFNVVIPEMRSGSFSGVIYDAWLADFMDPFAMLTPTYVTDSSGEWTDSEYLALLHEANRTLDPQARFNKLAHAEARLLHEMPIFPLAFQRNHSLQKPYVRGLHPDLLDGHSFRYAWIDTRWTP
jgi:oligopeptide transport system substrate-binding protein